MKDHYVKDYKEKELRQYILAYLLITVASIALHTDFSADNENLLDTLLKMAAIDIWVSGLSVLVVILNEMWPDAMKTEIVYGSMPSDTIFSEIAAEENEFCFDVDVAKEKYKRFSTLPPDKQSAEWYKLLHASREAKCGNVIEGQRMQLMTRDICMSTLSLLILTLLTVVIFVVLKPDGQECWQMFAVPVLYLSVMFFVTKVAAKNRARRFVELVIKEDLIKTRKQHCRLNPERKQKQYKERGRKKMNLSPEKKERVRWFHRVGLSVFTPVLSFVFAFASLILSICGNENILIGGVSLRQFAFRAAFVAAACQFAVSIFERVTKRKYLIMCRQEALSKATLLAQQKSNEAKTRNILQLTYGRVPEWRPFNFRKNVLVYDIHEQLRTLLVEIRDSVLMLSGETDSDKVTVDLVYCYPDDTYSGRLPEPSLHYGNEEPENAWRLITSGDASCINYTLHDFLRSNESFFFPAGSGKLCVHQ